MKLKRNLGITILSATLLLSGIGISADATTTKSGTAVSHSEKTDLPNIKILATGGTIAGSSDSDTDTTGYKAGALGVETLIEAVPQMKKVADVSGEQIANVGSQNMDNSTLLKLAKRIN